MKGLIIKDILTLKSSLKTVLVIVVIFGFMGAMSGSLYMSTFASVYAAILPMTCMAYDERSRFNRYAMIMPINKRDIVVSKYLTGLILAVVAVVIAAAMAVANGAELAETLLTGIAVPVFYHSLMLPLMFKFGVEKSRIVILIGVVIPAVAISFMEEAGMLSGMIQWLNSMDTAVVVAALAVIIAVLYIASILLSIAICAKKEW